MVNVVAQILCGYRRIWNPQALDDALRSLQIIRGKRRFEDLSFRGTLGLAERRVGIRCGRGGCGTTDCFPPGYKAGGQRRPLVLCDSAEGLQEETLACGYQKQVRLLYVLQTHVQDQTSHYEANGHDCCGTSERPTRWVQGGK